MTVTRLDPAFSVSSQIFPDDLAGLKAAGFRCIVNNRPDGEEPGQPRSAEIEAEAKRLGLDYRHIPVVPGRMRDAESNALAETVAAADGPVFAFCRSGARSAQLWERSRRPAGDDEG